MLISSAFNFQGENSKFTISVEKDGAQYLDFDTLPEINQPVFSKTNVIIRVKNSSVLDYETTPTLTFQVKHKADVIRVTFFTYEEQHNKGPIYRSISHVCHNTIVCSLGNFVACDWLS